MDAGRSRLIARLLALLVLLGALLQPAPADAASCRYALGFATLHDLIPRVVGDCLEDEQHDPDNGDALQRTTGGMLVWRRADNFTAFTDGYRTWVNGPLGLQQRLNTETFPWERPSATGPVTFVVLAGYGTSLSDVAPQFSPVQRELAARGWTAESFLPFSYAGGTVAAGQWRPSPYGCDQTAAPVAASVGVLGQTIAAFGQAHPGTRFVLIGHSLGGLVAWSYLAAMRTGQVSAAPIAGVVTVDAPLRGVGADKRLAAGLSSCGGAVLSDFAALYADADRLAGAYRELASWAAGRGIRVVTIGSEGDCLYYPRLAGCEVPYAALLGSSDDRATQYISGSELRLEIPIDRAWPLQGALGRVASSHLAPLSLPAFAARVAAAADAAARGS